MGESSRSKPNEYDPNTDYHHLKFENRCLRGSGDDFQKLFEDIMVRARPGEFERVRPYGRFGDRKCDGLIESEGTIFQVYSPDELKQSKVQKKIDEDLEGTVQDWSDILKKWVFVYNVKRGIAPDIKLMLQQKRQQYPDIEIDCWSNDYLWEITRGLSTEQRNEILGLPPSTTTKQVATPLISKQEYETNWRETCRRMLPIELDANPLISGDGVTLGIEDIVPLDLVEQKERPKPVRDSSPENAQRVLEDQEIPLPYNQFFERVLTECKSLNQQGKGIAIIGEPGSGKTTLLCAIADWITKQNELPVFVSLQDLETGLESYLLGTWLRNAICKREVPEQLQDDFIEQCNTGRVWLLLDGVDEMVQSQQSLSNLVKEFRGWVGNVRIVLTCRVNVWNANKNQLRSRFESYRSRGFRDKEQSIFIRNFFAKAKQAETGNELITKLTTAPSRLKDLVKSPLWITLLCRTWKRQQGKLPETKAELYESFTRTFYDWKDKPYVSEEKRPLLERALGELAKKAIDQEDFRFRLRETFVRQELDRFDSSLFRIACDELGWINKLGSAAENPDEPVYAFLHPTFQEYFAALAIDDWDYFLPREHKGEPIDGKSYKVFDSQWEEVLALWIGRGSLSFNKRDEFIRILVDFRDNCEFFYSYRAFFIAANLISEFKECSLREIIISKIVEFAFGSFQANLNQWVHYLEPISGNSKAILLKADDAITTNSLNRFIEEHKLSKEEAQQLIWSLLDRKNQFRLFTSTLDIFDDALTQEFNEPSRIDALINTLECSNNRIALEDAVDKLGGIRFKNRQVVDRLIYILEKFRKSAYEPLRERTIWYLGRVFNGEQEIVTTLLSVLRTPKNDFTLLTLFSTLVEVGRGNAVVINELELYLDNIKKNINNMEIIEQSELKSADQLAYILKVQDIYGEYFEVAKCLLRIDPANSKATDILIKVLKIPNNPTYDEIATIFIETLSSSRNFYLMIENLKELINRDIKQSNFQQFSSCFQILWHCAQNMNYIDFHQAWHHPLSTDDKLSTDNGEMKP